MLRKLSVFAFFILAFVILASTTLAIYTYPNQSLPFGNNQYYSVHLRGNGETVVTLKDIFTNQTDNQLSTLRYNFPRNIQLDDVKAYQVIQNRVCLRYGSVVPSPSPLYLNPEGERVLPITPTPTLIPRTGATQPSVLQRPICEEYQEPDYYSYNFGKSLYKKANVSMQGNTIVVSLTDAVAANESASILLVYRAYGYSEKNVFGTYEYTFQTLTNNMETANVQVGVTTDSDYVLKGTTGSVDYRETVGSLSLPSADSKAGIRSQQFDTLYYNIGQGNIVKSASNLAPNETYTVKGMYAQSPWKLYVKEILIGLFTLQLVIILTIVLGKKVWRMHHTSSIEKVPTPPKHFSFSDFVQNRKPVVVALTTSFIAALLVFIYTGMIFFITHLFSALVSYQFEVIIAIITVLISLCIYVVLIFGPSVYIGSKRGVAWGAGTLGMIAGWLFLFLICVVLVLFLTRSEPHYGGIEPMPMPRQGSSIDAVPPVDPLEAKPNY